MAMNTTAYTCKMNAHSAPIIALLAPYRCKVRFQTGEWGLFGRGSLDLAKSVMTFESSQSDHASIIVGDFCEMAGDCKILLGGEHHNERILNNTMGNFPIIRSQAKKAGLAFTPSFSRGTVHIGHNVVISQRVMIRSGVTIESGAVIGAGAIVTHDVPAFAIVAGLPAKLVKKRFDDASIEALLSLRWWDWELSCLSEHFSSLYSQTPLEALEYAKNQDIVYEERSENYVMLSAVKQDSTMSFVCEGVEINKRFIPLSELPENFQLYIAQAHAKHGQEIMIMHNLFADIRA